MPFFRRAFDRRHALARPAAPHDATAIAMLGSHAFRRYLTSTLEEVMDLLPHEPTAVLEYDGRLVGMAQAGWRMAPNAWLRTIIIDSRIEPAYALPLLIRQLHQLLPARAIESLCITIDDWSGGWLRRPLEAIGYNHIMDVWSYDKYDMDVPSNGNQAVTVRSVRSDDLAAVLRLDAACFPTPWGKGEEILGPAVITAPYFAVAEWQGEIIDYSYVTLHNAGRHAHLVRIAVAPACQGNAIGVRLPAEVVHYCRQRRIEVLSLNTQDYNTGAQRLYEWFGFERSDEGQVVLGVTLGSATSSQAPRV